MRHLNPVIADVTEVRTKSGKGCGPGTAAPDVFARLIHPLLIHPAIDESILYFECRHSVLYDCLDILMNIFHLFRLLGSAASIFNALRRFQAKI